MQETSDFYNDGTGWVCRHCDNELNIIESSQSHLPRYFREGESESKTSELEGRAMAKWLDLTRETLICPRCGLIGTVDKR